MLQPRPHYYTRPAPPRKGTDNSLPYFSPHVDCGQTAGRIKMPLGTQISLDPGDIVLDWYPVHSHGTGHNCPTPQFLVHVCCGQTVAHLSSCWPLVNAAKI